MHKQILILLVCVIFAQNTCFCKKPQSNHGQILEKKNIVIELFILTDVELSKMFYFDKERALQYWKSIMFNVHLHYKTLSGVKVTFDVVDIHMLKVNIATELYMYTYQKVTISTNNEKIWLARVVSECRYIWHT